LKKTPATPPGVAPRRGLDYLAGGDKVKALADLEQQCACSRPTPRLTGRAATTMPRREEGARAVQDYTTAIGLKLERTEVYTGRGKSGAGGWRSRKGRGGFHAGSGVAVG